MGTSASVASDAAPGRARRTLRLTLPDGGRLPEDVWRRRHHWILVLLWAHVPVIVAFGLIEGAPLGHLLVEVTPIAVLAAGAAALRTRPRWSAAVAALGLATCSGILVHLAGGAIEMHFHFFVMVAVITLYQDWPPFLAAITYVVAHHSIIGSIAPEAVFNHPAAIADPVTWALIHGGFIMALSVVGVISWNLNEITGAHVADREVKLAHAQKVAALGSWEWDIPSGDLIWSAEMYRLFGVSEHEFVPTYEGYLSLTHPDDRASVHEAVATTLRTHESLDFDFRGVRPDGSIRWMHSQGEVVAADGPTALVLYGTAHDITARKLAERDLRASQQASRLIQDVAVAANQASTLDHAMRTGLTAVSGFTGWPAGRVHLLAEDGCGSRRTGIWHLTDPALSPFRDAVCSSPAAEADDLAGRVLRSGTPAWDPDLAVAGSPLAAAAAGYGLGGRFALPVVAAQDVVAVLEFFARTADGPDPETIALLDDVGTQLGRVVERKQAQDALAHLAHHDPLTTLPNRALFLDRLGQALSQIGRRSTEVAILFMDLDGFKEINDSVGHHAGDRLLVELAERLQEAVRGGDTVARFGGDEFAILCPDLNGQAEAVELAERIAETVARPFVLAPEREFIITASIGIAVARPGDDDTADTNPSDLLRDADLAMYRAKERGRAGYAVFDGSLLAAASARGSLGADLRRAVEHREFRLHYQPQVMLGGDGTVVGVEALIRWEHPERGLVSPGEFIPVAEQTGLIVPIGAWVVDEACAQLGRWQAAGRPDLSMCVNVSARQLADLAIVGVVERALATHGVMPSTLCLEITESVLMEDPDHYADTLGRLKELGVALSVDDFGTGYSSLAYLQQLPADFLKIDKSFVDELGVSPRAAAIVRTVVDLAHSFDMVVVAEGVENAAQAGVLADLGCEQAQGFLFFRPASADLITPAVMRLPSVAKT